LLFPSAVPAALAVGVLPTLRTNVEFSYDLVDDEDERI
jgi:hypothetical protein